MLTDDALLAIFDFCAGEQHEYRKQQVWQRLVHVCRRWRSLVLGSPRSLNLQLICTSRTPARDMLDVWPSLPLVIQSYYHEIQNMDNIVAVLEHRNRVCKIHIEDISSSQLVKVLVAMREPFPELIRFKLTLKEKMATVVPDSFLGGSAPRLRYLYFYGIPFPDLPNLLLSAAHITDLHLSGIPQLGYFSPDAMATALSTLTSLARLQAST